MNIRLNQVIPAPLKDSFTEGSIWNTVHELQPASYCLVNAASGKGKSTLLSYLYGLRRDFSGQILFDDRDISGISLAAWSDLRKNKLAMMFQDLRLFDDLSAMDNIRLKNDLTKTFSVQEIMDMAEILGITGLLDKPARLLSMGQQQRVTLIRTLAQPFRWLLLDEPFSHLDKVNISKTEQLIDAACKKNGAGLILTTLGEQHDLHYTHSITV
jgi:putative ABC transport system ATP-binding protein